jgi:hypothetical protein
LASSGTILQCVVLVGIAAVIPVGASAASSAAFPPRVASVGYSLISTSTPPAPPAIPLAPNDRGYVRVESKSGSTRCSIAGDLVDCQTTADNWPVHPNGQHFHTASVSADGDFHWVNADLGALEGRVTSIIRPTAPLVGRSPPPQTTPPSPMPATACPSVIKMYNHSDHNNISAGGHAVGPTGAATREPPLIRPIGMSPRRDTCLRRRKCGEIRDATPEAEK